MTTKEQEIAEWYDDWHKKHKLDSWRPEAMYHPFIKLLDAEPGQRLLDLGCGTGYFLKAASDAGLETTGIDISAEAVAMSKRVSPSSNVSVRSMEWTDGNGTYDFVTAFGSMEHCVDIKRALTMVTKSLKPSGKFIAMVPNSDFDGPKWSIQDEIMETRKSLKGWRELFESEGFVVESVDEDMAAWRPDVPIEKTYQFIFTLTQGGSDAS